MSGTTRMPGRSTRPATASCWSMPTHREAPRLKIGIRSSHTDEALTPDHRILPAEKLAFIDDHLILFVSRTPDAVTELPSVCGSCLTIRYSPASVWRACTVDRNRTD